jgi:hypothetical protein
MSFPGSPKLLKGGIVLLDPDTAAVRRVINLQYNPDSLTRSLQVQAISNESGDRAEALRFKSPPLETIKLDAELDITDQLEFPEQNPDAVQSGLYPQLAVLEAMVYPTSTQLQNNNRLAQSGTLEIVPMLAPLALFVWSKYRVLPVKITDFSITEEAFDPSLNPIRAKISLGLRVFTVNDLDFNSKGGGLFMTYLQQKEQLAARSPAGTLSAFGIGGIG